MTDGPPTSGPPTSGPPSSGPRDPGPAGPGLPVLPDLDDVLDAAVVVALPLRVRFRGILVREALLVRGPAGWGEFSPFVEYADAEAAPWLAAGLEAAWTGLPAPLRDRVVVNATVPAVPAARVAEVLSRFPGCTTAKVKVAEPGQDLADDLARVAAVRDALGPGGSVRVDANGGWDVPAAARALAALRAQGELEYAEQPCAGVPELVALRALLRERGVDVPIAADESIRRAEDPFAVARSGAADVAVLKVAPLGGVRALLGIAEALRRDHGMRTVVSSALDTAVGITAGLAAAAALPVDPGACGLGTGGLLAADVAAPRTPVDGSLAAPGGAAGGVSAGGDGGAGGRVDAAALAEHAADGPTRDRWLARLRRCHALLPASGAEGPADAPGRPRPGRSRDRRSRRAVGRGEREDRGVSNPSTDLARALVTELVRLGVRHVLLCPGSRSAPLAYALHAADAAGVLELHVRHDERSAGFTALGVGRAGLAGAADGPAAGAGGPAAGGALAALVTTSGTAVANLVPAVLEASEAGVPLLLLTADRPRHLRGTWANQTTALQAGVFGAAVRSAHDVGTPDPAGALAALAAAVAAARGGAAGGGRPGPVHVDVGLEDPLVPDDTATWPFPSTSPSGPPRAAAAREGAVPEAVLPGVALERGPRTVVVAGDGAGPAARRLAESAGWPLLAEPSSGSRGGPCAVAAPRLLAGHPGLGGRVERVVAFGRPTLSRPVSALLARGDVELVQVVRHPADPGPGPGARRVASAALAPVPAGTGGAAGVPESATDDPRRDHPAADHPAADHPAADHPATDGAATADAAWLAGWQRAGAAAAAAVDAVLDEAAAGGALTGPLVARELAAATGEDEVLVAAASNAVRDLDLAAAPWAVHPRAVLANRGLSGIDGTTSTAAGASLASGATVRLLVGDLAFLHDLNALLLPPAERRPDVRVVLLDDDGGGIFTGLEHGEPHRAATFERLFGTPHGSDVAALCAGYGASHRRATTLAELRAALTGPPPVRADGRAGPGFDVVHVVADRTDLRALHARVAGEVAAAVSAALDAPG